MVREFKIRRTPFKVWLGVIIVIVAIVLMALHTENYWNLMPIVLPVLLLIDEQMTRILVQENGDIWLKRGFYGPAGAAQPGLEHPGQCHPCRSGTGALAGPVRAAAAFARLFAGWKPQRSRNAGHCAEPAGPLSGAEVRVPAQHHGG